MKKKIVHKNMRWSSLSVRCGLSIWNQDGHPRGLYVTKDWKNVTCKNCLKTRKDKSNGRR